jgi:hypothetical protein
MAKAKKVAPKGKKERKVLTAEEKQAKKDKMADKYAAAVDKYVTINETGKGKDLITTAAMAIRGMGCMVRTSGPNGVSEVFVPGVKIKTKSAWKTLVEIKVKDKD